MNQNNSLTHKLDLQNILFVSDLSRETTEEDIADYFKNYHFICAKINRGKLNNFAFVHFENPDYGIFI